jgi:hypothetical protein
MLCHKIRDLAQHLFSCVRACAVVCGCNYQCLCVFVCRCISMGVRMCVLADQLSGIHFGRLRIVVGSMVVEDREPLVWS